MTRTPADLLRVHLSGLDHVEGTNYAQNPSFEHGLDTWFAPAGRTMSRVNAGAYVGDWRGVLQLTEAVAPGDNQPLFRQNNDAALDVTPGEVWSFGLRVRANADALAVRLRVRQFDPTPQATLVLTPDIPVDFSQWHLVKVEGVVIPEGCNRIRLEVFAAVDGVPASAWYYVDAVQAHRSATLPAYFDGDTPASGDHVYRWTGTPGASTSEKVRDTEVLTPSLQNLDIVRGGSTDGAILAVQVGTATVTLAGDYSHVRPDTELVVEHTQVAQRLFTGRVQDTTVAYTKDRGRMRARSVLSVTDNVAVLNNTPRYGATITQNLTARINALLTSAPEVTRKTPRWSSPISNTCAGIVYESTVANHLTLACNNNGTAWRIDRNGALDYEGIIGRGDLSPDGPVFADGTGTRGGGKSWSPYVDIHMSNSTRDQVTAVAINNHGMKPDPENPGNTIADDRAYGPYADASAEALYGRRAITIDTCAVVGGSNPTEHVDEIGAWWSTVFRVRRRPTWIRINARDWWHLAAPWRPYASILLGATHLNATMSVDVGSPVPVDFDGVRYLTYVAQIRHQITPETWHVELNLGDMGVNL